MLGFIGLTLLAGVASADVALVNMHGWYAKLAMPAWALPCPIPMHVWSLLVAVYVLMAVGAWRVWRVNQMPPQRAAMHAWGWQLALGAAWPAMFFGFHALSTAAIIAIVLIPGVALTIWRFARLDMTAAILLAPDLIWAGFAGYLTAGFWWLNH